MARRYLVLFCVFVLPLCATQYCSVPYDRLGINSGVSQIGNLTTCSKVNGRTLDSFFVSFKDNDSHLSYAEFMDNIINIVSTKFYEWMEEQSRTYDIGICGDCVQNILDLMCGSAFPAAGTFPCLWTQLADITYTQCRSQCPCDNSCCYPPDGGQCDVVNPDYDPDSNCTISSTELSMLSAFSSCLETKIPSKTDCESVVGVCSCDEADSTSSAALQVCDDYYPVNGTNLPLTGGFCSFLTRWCAESTQVKREPWEGIQLNYGLEIGIPIPVIAALRPSTSGSLLTYVDPEIQITPPNLDSDESSSDDDWWHEDAGPLIVWQWWLIAALVFVCLLISVCVLVTIIIVMHTVQKKKKGSYY